MIKVGIVGAAGYAAGELIRVLLNHPQAEIVFANSGSNAGNLFSDVHEGLLGDTDLRFTDELPFEKIDVLFICLGHGKSEEFLKNNPVPANVKIIDFAQDFRIAAPGNDYVYGLPETHRSLIAKAQHVANPGCFATCIQLALLPLAKMPAGGFIVLGILCAIWRAAAAKRKEYLKKEARDTLTVHYQKEADREP